jgi:hypothetical protein
METHRKSFEIARKKGELGENLIREYLEQKGWIVYFPFTKNKAHYFDMLATKDKAKAIAVDVKTKARLNKWPAQGINKKSYLEYMNFVTKTNIPFFLVFVDDKSGDVHSFELNENSCKYTEITPYIIGWPIAEMKYLFNIGAENIEKLSKFDQRNYNYLPLD